MKVKINLNDFSLEYMDQTPFIQGNDERNFINVYTDSSIEMDDIKVSYLYPNKRTSIPIQDSGSDSETIDNVLYHITKFALPLVATKDYGQIEATFIIEYNDETYKVTCTNTILKAAEFEELQNALQGAAADISANLIASSAAITELQQHRTSHNYRISDLERRSNVNESKISSLNTECFGDSTGATNTSHDGLHYIVRTDHEDRLDTIEDKFDEIEEVKSDNQSNTSRIETLETTVGVGDNSLNTSHKNRINSLEIEVGDNNQSSSIKGRIKAIEDSDFQSQIDAINAGQNLADIVADLTSLNSYDTTNLQENDKVQVLDDINHEHSSTVYNWTGSEWSYIGKYGQNTYTKNEVDIKVGTLANQITDNRSRIGSNTTSIEGIQSAIGTDSTENTIKGRIKAIEDEIGTSNDSVAGTLHGDINIINSTIGDDSTSGTVKGRIKTLEDNSVTTSEMQTFLSANYVSKSNVIESVDDLTGIAATSTSKVLSANVGTELKTLITSVQNLLASDDTDLDTIQEIVTYIKDNKEAIESITQSSVLVDDIVDDLVSTDTDKPLSANMGKELKDLIDALEQSLDMSSYYTKTEADDLLDAKQDTLVDTGNDQNIKTINSESLLGTGKVNVKKINGIDLVGDDSIVAIAKLNGNPLIIEQEIGPESENPNLTSDTIISYNINIKKVNGVDLVGPGEDLNFNVPTFTPNVNEYGTISWTNNQGLTNPESRSIRGPRGYDFQYRWDETKLGVKNSNQNSYTYQDLRGPQGIQGEQGEKGDTGEGFNCGTLNKTLAELHTGVLAQSENTSYLVALEESASFANDIQFISLNDGTRYWCSHRDSSNAYFHRAISDSEYAAGYAPIYELKLPHNDNYVIVGIKVKKNFNITTRDNNGVTGASIDTSYRSDSDWYSMDASRTRSNYMAEDLFIYKQLAVNGKSFFNDTIKATDVETPVIYARSSFTTATSGNPYGDANNVHINAKDTGSDKTAYRIGVIKEVNPDNTTLYNYIPFIEAFKYEVASPNSPYHYYLRHPMKSGVIATIDDITDAITNANIPQGSDYLPKLSYEYNRELRLGGNERYIYIGDFPMGDSNVTIEVSSTLDTTSYGVLVIATQNINTSRGGVYECKVYGDSDNRVAPNFKIQYSSGSNNFKIYYDNRANWSKVLFHIRAITNNEPTINFSIISSLPTTDLLTINNALSDNYLKLTDSTGGAYIYRNTDTPLNLKSNTTNSYLGFYDSSQTALGWIGVNSSHKPIFNYNSADYEIITSDGGSITGALNVMNMSFQRNDEIDNVTGGDLYLGSRLAGNVYIGIPGTHDCHLRLTGILKGNSGYGLKVQSQDNGAWKEGIRIYQASNNYAVLALVSNDNADYVTALVSNSANNQAYLERKTPNGQFVMHLPEKSGTLALTSDVPRYMHKITFTDTSDEFAMGFIFYSKSATPLSYSEVFAASILGNILGHTMTVYDTTDNTITGNVGYVGANEDAEYNEYFINFGNGTHTINTSNGSYRFLVTDSVTDNF